MGKLCIIGGGHAAGKLVNNLQKLNYKDDILVFSEEDSLPYERPPLSKDFLLGSKQKNDFHIDIDLDKISYYYATKINKIDFEKKLIFDSNNTTYSYDRLVFANGSKPKKISHLDIYGVHYLRSIKDSIKIREGLEKSKNIVLLGGGFISLEISSSIKQKYPNKKVSIIDTSKKILFRNSNDDLREIILKYQKQHHVNFYLDTGLRDIEKNVNGYIETIILSNNEKIACDLLVVGIGVTPNTEILKGSQIYFENGIKVNEYCETEIKDVYAIGDIAFAKNMFLDKHIREESWNNAEKQSFILAQNLTGTKTAFNEIPWFWTDQFKQNFQILGDINDYDSKIFRNYLENKKTILYFKKNKMVGALSENNGRDISIIRKMIKKDVEIDLEKIQNIEIDLKNLL